MKKKSQIVALLDDLRSEDPKKKLLSVQSLKEIATVLGPLRTRTQLLQYLGQFVDDEQNIVLELLNQLSNFSAELGGQEFQKNLLPLLINFCKTDEKQQTQKALQIMEPILRKNKDLIAEVIKKLSKIQMNSTKHAAAYLTSRLVQLVPQSQSQLIEIFSGMVFSDIAHYKIIASKQLLRLLDSVKNKEEIGKMIQVIYSDNDDLPKIYSLGALVGYYAVNSNVSMGKFKALLGLNNWRINAKICEVIPSALNVFSKQNFKATFEPSLLKFFSSNEPELRCKSCDALTPLASVMSEDEIKKNLIPAVKKLSTDPVDYVQLATSQNIASLIEVLPVSLINQELLPIILTFIKNNEMAKGVLQNFQTIIKKFPADLIEEKILNPLLIQLDSDNWKVKCQLIELLTGVIGNSFFLNEKLTTILVHLTQDKINAVREKATQLIISIICQQSPQWCDSMIIPKIQCLKQSPSYIERQIMLEIIEKTCEKVSQKTLIDNYRQTVMTDLNDKVPNVRVKALKVLKSCKKLNDKSFQKLIDKLKSDPDPQIKKLATEFGK